MQAESGTTPSPDQEGISEPMIPILKPADPPRIAPFVVRINNRAISRFLQAAPMSVDTSSGEDHDGEPSGHRVSDLPSGTPADASIQQNAGSWYRFPLRSNIPVVSFEQAPVTTEPGQVTCEETGLVLVPNHRPDTALSLPANPISTKERDIWQPLVP